MEYTISQVTKMYDVTACMLRYYEQKGLITPIRREDYAYRIYDEDTVRRLRLIIILRRLRIPLKATPHNYRLAPLSFACLHIFRHIAQISFDGRQPACTQFVQSDEKSDGAIKRQ